MSGKKHKGPVRACLITSPRSGSGEFHLDEVLPVLLGQGWDVAVREKREKGDAIKLAREAANDGYDPIVNCGGDGTLNEIVQALTGTDVAVGTIPGGTVNVWSREVGISSRGRVAATQLVASERVRIDVGQARVNGDGEHRFLMMAGLGADAAVMDRVSRNLKNRLGPLAVGVAAAESIPALKAVAVELDMDGVRWEGKITELILGNTRKYGGFTRVTPEAYADDSLLDVCIFTTDGLLGTARQMTSMLVRKHPSQASAEFYRAAGITVRASIPLPLQVDGSVVDLKDKHGDAEYRFSLIPKGLVVLVPRTYDGSIFEGGIHPNGHAGKDYNNKKNGKGKGKKHKES